MKYILCLFLVTIGISCQKIDSNPLEPVKNPEQQSNAGPYQVSFDPETGIYQHDVKINIQQNEGYFEYKIFSEQKDELQLIQNQVSVSGCAGQNVKQDIFWLPDQTNKTVYQLLYQNTIFYTAKKINGSLIYNFKNLNGCTEIQMRTQIKKNFRTSQIGKACRTDLTIQDCQIIAYCKENTTLKSFYEVEVQNQNGKIFLAKFYKTEEGQRILSGITSASSNEGNLMLVYTGTSTNMSLEVNKLNYMSIFSEFTNGISSTKKMTCDI